MAINNGFPIKNGDFSIAMLVYQRVTPGDWTRFDPLVYSSVRTAYRWKLKTWGWSWQCLTVNPPNFWPPNLDRACAGADGRRGSTRLETSATGMILLGRWWLVPLQHRVTSPNHYAERRWYQWYVKATRRIWIETRRMNSWNPSDNLRWYWGTSASGCYWNSKEKMLRGTCFAVAVTSIHLTKSKWYCPILLYCHKTWFTEVLLGFPIHIIYINLYNPWILHSKIPCFIGMAEILRQSCQVLGLYGGEGDVTLPFIDDWWSKNHFKKSLQLMI